MDTLNLAMAIKDVVERDHKIIQILVNDICKRAINNARLLDAARAADEVLIALSESLFKDDSKAHLITVDHISGVRSKLVDALRIAEAEGV